MSVSREKCPIIFEEKVGSRRTLTLTITDENNDTINMEDEAEYSYGYWKVWKADGTLIINGAIEFFSRPNGQVEYELGENDCIVEKVGTHTGEVEIYDEEDHLVEQSDNFTMIIKYSQ